jgi:hypothetical protein
MIRALSKAVLAVSVLCACSSRGQRTCARNEDCGIAATCSNGVCLGQAPVVTITSPSSGAFANGALKVEVAVANGVAEKLELLASGVLVTSLGSLRTYDWDTTAVPEGSYELVARAIMDGQVVASEPRTVVVDRTAPAVVARAPQPGDGNVPFGAPFQVTFSEPMLSASMTDTGIEITDSNGVSLPKHLALSADGQTMSVILDGRPPLPAPLAISLQGLTDLAGNALAAPGSWNFTVQVATDHTAPTVLERVPASGEDNVAIGTPLRVTFSEPILPDSVNDGAVVVTGGGGVALSKYLELSADCRALSITLAGAPALPTSVNIDLPGLTDLAGNSVVPAATAWSFTIPDWWHPWSLPVNDALEESAFPSVATDADGSPIVTYVENVGEKKRLFVRRWDGAAWRDLGSPLSVIGDAYVSAVAIAPDGTPVVAWVEYVPANSQQFVLIGRWNGTGWRSMSGDRIDSSQALNTNKAANEQGGVHANPGGMKVALALDGVGNPVVAWPEVVGSGTSSRFNYFAAQWSGGRWNGLGSANTPGTNCWDGAVLVENGRPLLALQENDPVARVTNVRIRRWDNGWASPYGAGTVDSGTTSAAFSPGIALDATGAPIVAYMEYIGTTHSVVLKRWDRYASTWSTVLPDGASDRIPYAYYPELAANARGELILAYALTGGIRVARWDSTTSAWRRIGSLASSQGNAGAALAVSPDGVPFVAWVDNGPTTPAGGVVVKTPNE